ncbi:MAG: sensor domain-containing diguanylate cyclase [Vicinamibacterales bacterium]|nr:sensor domain-containing diguanylate cyclase [Vicinamibacterales bacterium]
MALSQGARPDLAARLREGQRALRGRLGRADTQLAMMRAAHETLDPSEIGELVVDHASAWLPASPCAVVAPNREGHIDVLASRAVPAALAEPAVAIGRWVLRHERGFLTADLRQDGRVTAPAGAALGWPLRCRGRTVAALVIVDRTPATAEPRITAGVGQALDEVLSGPAVALDNALTVQRAEALSVTDDLTQLYNSRYMNQVLRRETKRASRSGRPLSFLFLDLDGFKGVNDVHGHLAGSQALVEAAVVIRGSARETDIVARFGGDEFALILPDTGSEGAAAVGERIRERLAAHTFLADDGLALRLTASVGVATLPDVAASAEELVRAADMAMYRVKAAGKDGIHVAVGD